MKLIANEKLSNYKAGFGWLFIPLAIDAVYVLTNVISDIVQTNTQNKLIADVNTRKEEEWKQFLNNTNLIY
ncbi:hypothetical protein [Spiroplasma endosymbiont of Amphibalanus improvisus]|uniref:hypothetical protein n=1 Tax=Spiroplasma endosymbiont of Amphibalanus improvisus TaxID=3066327 RepID=UPI00313AD2B6